MGRVIETNADSSAQATASPAATDSSPADMAASPVTAQPAPAHGRQIFGQPRGLATLFLTEMWERFSFYGARSILILFMTAAVSQGGLGIADKKAASIYG